MLESWLHLWSHIECFSTILFACEILFCMPTLGLRRGTGHAISVSLAFLVAFNSRAINNAFGMGWFISATTMVIFAASVATIHAIFSCSKRIALFYGAAGYATENLIFYIRWIDSYFPSFPIQGPRLFLFKFALSLIVAFLVYTYLARRYPRGHEPNVSNVFMLSFAVLTLLVTNVLNTWVRMDGLFAPPVAILAILCNLMLLMIEFDVFKRSSMEQERQIMEHLMVERERQQRLSQENVDLINIKCHDLKHQIAALRDMPAGSERDETIGALEQAVMFYDSATHTGNTALDTVLTEKSLLCERRSIDFTCMVDGGCLAGIGTVDLYTLFGNALDNAIEATERLSDPEERMISLHVVRQGSFARISVENTCAGSVELRDGFPATSKDDGSYHGFGLKSIAMIVDRLGGNMVITPGNGHFSLAILIPCIAEASSDPQAVN
ncbi:GHKL domain-containing protein [Coriobacteriales bacterium OH1046]|nr:GHKL domain-containing protein [Coriobacteriales bacterium OH1046]